ncbi:hypothetical protein CLOSTASPAR_04345 [[Clostridium] asparagiforme DSM 15981]|uniref:Uncharacterized protein n=1 Tax=[Clostridium] asparagiforme DSM 15981 TaxID=518636 RepID=C0D500_9FIRM|nr:hypothetical protein CLOSTASPAR_04345 [[Clostridium] asparagiforme DSM 15981]
MHNRFSINFLIKPSFPLFDGAAAYASPGRPGGPPFINLNKAISVPKIPRRPPRRGKFFYLLVFFYI